MIPSRSLKSNFAKHILYTEINSINIFIEDTEKGIKKIFLELLQKSLQEYNIEEIFPLEGRDSVLTKHQEYIEKKYSSDGNNIFIVDGDLYLFNQNIIPYKGLLGLNKYCFENYLIDEQSIIEFLYYEDSDKNRSEIKNILAFDTWCNDNLLLYYLFILYGISHSYMTGIKTTSYKITNLISGNDGTLDKKKVVKRILNLKKEILLKIGNNEYKNSRNSIFNTISFNQDNMLSYVSGKDYLFPLLILRMKTVTKFNYKNEILKLKLAKKCDSSFFTQIKEMMI